MPTGTRTRQARKHQPEPQVNVRPEIRPESSTADRPEHPTVGVVHGRALTVWHKCGTCGRSMREGSPAMLVHNRPGMVLRCPVVQVASTFVRP